MSTSTTSLVRQQFSGGGTSLTDLTGQAKSTATQTLNKMTPTSLSQSTSGQPSTPQQQQPSPAISTPGRWQHPRMEEVLRRQNRTHFDRSNVNAVVCNSLFLLASFLVSALVNSIYLTPWNHTLRPYSTYVFLLVRLFFLLNIGLACTPLFRKPDTCEDVPLTPQQRQLLGLPPMSRSATPQEKEQYVTPPRYSRSATPSSRGSVGSLRNVSGSGTPTAWRSPSGSPMAAGGLAPRPGSGSGAERRKLSYNQVNRSSPLSVSEFDAIGGSLNSPTTKSRASVGLNSKWLYEKGKGMSGSGWGSGSVFS